MTTEETTSTETEVEQSPTPETQQAAAADATATDSAEATGPNEETPANVRDAYRVNLDEVEEKADGEEAAGEAKEEKEDEPFALEWPEGYEATPEFAAVATEAARGCGLTGKAAGAYTARVLDALQEAELRNVEQTDAELKAEWGSDYEPRMKACKGFLARHARRSGLTDADVAVLQSPKGFRLLNSFMEALGESQAHGLGTAVSADEKSWAASVMKDTKHPDYEAFRDADHPRHEEVARRWYRAQGASV